MRGEVHRSRASMTALLATVFAAVMVAACSAASPAAPAASDGVASPSGTATPVATTPTATDASAAPTMSPIATPAPSVVSSPLTGTVDLTFTGKYNATAKGTAGCKNVVGDGQTFFWQAGEHDYPGLYDGVQIAELAAKDAIDIKWIIRGPITFVSADPIPYSGDGHTVTVDADLTGDTGVEHVTGTVTCP